MDKFGVKNQFFSTRYTVPDIARLGTAVLFIIIIGILIASRADGIANSNMLIIAAMIGGYMAMNIGANDVANNVGPAVGSRALTLTGAILIAVVFEAGGALIAGGDVVSTIKKGIIDPAMIPDSNVFIWVMMAALLAAAIWLNIATAIGAPVSTTHSIVGGVLGAGIAAAGWDIVNWATMGKIAASWVISPALGGIIAAFFLYVIKRGIVYKSDQMLAAKRVVPIMVSLMIWAFSVYIILKGFKKLWKVDFPSAGLIGFGIAVVAYIILKPIVSGVADKLKNSREGVNQMFTIPLIFSAALLSFAHGANDVANAVGPLAAINDSIMNGGVASKASIPFWVMLIGAVGIAIGLALYGPKLIKTVGSEITELDKMRAFCVAMAAALTVILASQLGLPVSSTHIAVGGIFGVGFLREYLAARRSRRLLMIREQYENHPPEVLEKVMAAYEAADFKGKGKLIADLKAEQGPELIKADRKGLKKAYREELVQRAMLLKIAAAWVTTVPLAGVLAALLYFLIRGIMVPY